MLTKRIIPCLDIKNGRTVKGTNFLNLRDAGDPVELAERYSKTGADELVFLDISATEEKRRTLVDLVVSIAKQVNIPFTVGGGVSSVEDAELLLKNGADKIAINSAAIRNPELIGQLASRFGSQCITVAIDAKIEDNTWQVYSSGGTILTGLELFSWAREVETRGAGEILFTSMNHDGTKKGFAVEALKQLSEMVTLPIIASGGAGNVAHFCEVFTKGKADAALAASVFHYQEILINDVKNEMSRLNIPVRLST